MNEDTVPVLGDAAEKIIACNQRLQELRIDTTIKLARIVVIGDQSTGKSTLLELISSIFLPKSAECCTRCPLEINLSNSTEAWTCTIYVEENFTYDATRKKLTKNNSYGPWQQSQDPRTTRIGTTQDRNKVDDLINLAQKVVLNPGYDIEELLNGSSPVTELERFSPNTIRFDISAPGWSNLSFVDLPGIISHAGRDQPEYYVKLVENLAQGYAQDENNIILLTLPLNHHEDNSNSYRITAKARVHSRTVAVFTKPDLADQDQLDRCFKKYFGEEIEEEFGYGQHIVMLGGAKKEDDFFARGQWPTLPQHMQDSLGVANLTDRIRGILFEQTRKTLPENLISIRTRLQQINHELQDLPPPPDAAALPWQLREQFLSFEKNARLLFAHGSESRQFLNKRMQNFSTEIAKDEPKLKYKTKREIELSEDAESRLREASLSPVVELDDDDADSGSDSKTPKKTTPAEKRFYCFDLVEIYRLNKKLYNSNVPVEIAPNAVEEMNRMGVQYWDKSVADFIVSTSKLVTQQIRKCVEEEFGRQKHLPLYRAVMIHAETYASDILEESNRSLKKMCSTEKDTPFTLDHKRLSALEKAIFKERLEKRLETRLAVERAVQKADHIGQKGKLKQIDESALEPDQYEQELLMSAKAAAYYRLASKRFIDNVCQCILTDLVPKLHNTMTPFILGKLGLENMHNADQDRIADLMSEDPEREAQRRRLVREEANLKSGHDYIREVLETIADGPQLQLTNGDTDMRDAEQPTAPQTPGSNKRKANGDVDAEIDVTPTRKSRKEAGQMTVNGASRRSGRSTMATRMKSMSLEPEE